MEPVQLAEWCYKRGVYRDSDGGDVRIKPCLVVKILYETTMLLLAFK